MKKLFVDLEKEIPISELEKYLDEFEAQTRNACLSIFLSYKSMNLVISCDHPFAGGSNFCGQCRIYKFGKYNRNEILGYIKNGIIYSRRGNRIMK